MKIQNSTRVYIAGCAGMLGDAVYKALSGIASVKATDIDVIENWIEYADVRDCYAIREAVISFRPNIIINLAALTDMEQCEQEPENAWLTNALGTENLGLLANELDVPYVYISTAGIFGSEEEEHNDFEIPNPASVYAKSKFAGEIFVREHVRKYYVVRAGWMMGGGPRKDKKFINKIYKQIKAGATQLNVVDDKFGTPTYTHDFAHGLIKLLESDLYGVYNQACEGSCSRHEVALEFLRLLGLDEVVKVNKVSSDFFKKEYFAHRPRSEKLSNLKLKSRGLFVMRNWKVALAEYAGIYLDDLSMGVLRNEFTQKYNHPFCSLRTCST